jgi:hypothetical protein
LECPGRYIQFFDALKLRSMVLAGTLYYQISGVIRPWGPASGVYRVTREQALLLCRRLRGHLVITTHGFAADACQGWYAVICDQFRSLDQMKAKNRSEINRGLRNCPVQQVDAGYVARNGYEVYNEAVRSYPSYYTDIETETEFRERHQDCLALSDVVHYWGAFHKGQLVGFSQNILFGRTEVNYWTVRLHPAFLHLYPSYALFYRMNEFYLQGDRFGYVNDGWRSLLHETQVQRFLIRKFGFHKAYCPVSVVYKPTVRLLVRACYPFRRLLTKVDLRLAGLCTLEAIRRGKDTGADAPGKLLAESEGSPS